MATMTIGIREAKANLSRFLKSVQEGNEVVLTDHGRPVGKIVPIPTAELPLSVRLQRLEEQGVVSPAPDRFDKCPAPIALPDDLAQRLLQEERGNE